MKIISWNVNGLRAILKNNFIDFLEEYNPDIIGLQETKLQQMQIPNEITNLKNYHQFWSFAERKGYSGTCLFTKTPPLKVNYDIGSEKFNGEGRIIQAEFENFIIFNIYYPNGQMNEDRLEYKLKFYDQFLTHVENLRKSGKNIIAIGDFNTAHKEIDLTHPKANSKYSGFLPIERAWLDKFIETGYVDTFREFDQSPEKYSWWSYMGQSRQKNVGWRIDYCFVNKEFMPYIKNAFILNEVRGSDHCPVGIDIK